MRGLKEQSLLGGGGLGRHLPELHRRPYRPVAAAAEAAVVAELAHEGENLLRDGLRIGREWIDFRSWEQQQQQQWQEQRAEEGDGMTTGKEKRRSCVMGEFEQENMEEEEEDKRGG